MRYGSILQIEELEPRQGALSQDGGKGRGAYIVHMRKGDTEVGHRRQRAR